VLPLPAELAVGAVSTTGAVAGAFTDADWLMMYQVNKPTTTIIIITHVVILVEFDIRLFVDF
jgi:hypothetical protein